MCNRGEIVKSMIYRGIVLYGRVNYNPDDRACRHEDLSGSRISNSLVCPQRRPVLLFCADSPWWWVQSQCYPREHLMNWVALRHPAEYRLRALCTLPQTVVGTRDFRSYCCHNIVRAGFRMWVTVCLSILVYSIESFFSFFIATPLRWNLSTKHHVTETTHQMRFCFWNIINDYFISVLPLLRVKFKYSVRQIRILRITL